MATVKTKLSEQPPVNLAPQTTEDDVQQNMAMIFGTVRGTVPFMRAFGVDIGFIDTKLLDDINDIVDEAYEQTEQYEPRVEITNVDTEAAGITGDVEIAVKYELKDDEDEEEDDE